MATKQKTVLRVDVYPSDFAGGSASVGGTGMRYRFKVIDAKGKALAYGAQSYASTRGAWRAARRLLLDPADAPSVPLPGAKKKAR